MANDARDPFGPLASDDSNILPDLTNNPAPPPEEPDQRRQLPDAVQEKIDQYKRQQVENIKSRFQSGEKKLAEKGVKSGTEAAESAVKKEAGAVSRRGARAAAKATGQAAKAAAQAAKQVASQAAKAVGTFLVDNPIGWIILAIILVVFIIIGIVLLFSAFSGSGGSGPPVYPTTEVQKSQAGLLAAIGGDRPKQFSTIVSVIDSEEKRYDKIEQLVKTDPGSERPLAESLTQIDKVQDLLKQADQAARAQDRKRVDQLLKETIEQEKAAEGPLPFSSWITTIANKAENNPSTQFCRLTGAPTNLGCASVVSVILNQAGVPQSIVAATMGVWNNPTLTLLISPLPGRALDKGRAAASVGSLKPGDIVWWGNGIRGGKVAYAGALFNHIGIYVGDGLTVDNSSSQDKVLKRKLDRSDQAFNGAKRYDP